MLFGLCNPKNILGGAASEFGVQGPNVYPRWSYVSKSGYAVCVCVCVHARTCVCVRARVCVNTHVHTWLLNFYVPLDLRARARVCVWCVSPLPIWTTQLHVVAQYHHLHRDKMASN